LAEIAGKKDAPLFNNSDHEVFLRRDKRPKRDYGGGGWKPGGTAVHLTKAARVIVMAPFLSKVDRMEFGAGDKVVWYKTWEEVLADLMLRHGSGTKAGIYPYPPIQIPA
jgi:hypothetical protein